MQCTLAVSRLRTALLALALTDARRDRMVKTAGAEGLPVSSGPC